MKSNRASPTDRPAVGGDLVERVLRGGYPEAIVRTSSKRRITWARQYIDAIIQRDVRDVADIEKLDQLPRFLRALTQTVGQMCNYTQLGGQVGLYGKTAARYLGVLEQMFGREISSAALLKRRSSSSSIPAFLQRYLI